jgi:hypothetical protein
MNERKIRRPEPEDEDLDEAPARKQRQPEPDEEEVDEAPVRKKKKKKKKKQGSSVAVKIGVYVGAGAVALALVIGLIWAIVRMATAPPAQPVTAWERFNMGDNQFAFDYPAGWRVKDFGLPGKREAEIKGSTATITIAENLTGSLVGDVANALNQGREVGDDRLPVSQVHEMRRPKDRASYKEEAPFTVMTKFGKARCSAYTDGSERGYRATVLMNQTALDIFCWCRGSDWETLRPAFDRIIASLARS